MPTQFISTPPVPAELAALIRERTTTGRLFMQAFVHDRHRGPQAAALWWRMAELDRHLDRWSAHRELIQDRVVGGEDDAFHVQGDGGGLVVCSYCRHEQLQLSDNCVLPPVRYRWQTVPLPTAA